MSSLDYARELVAKSRFREAAAVLDRLIAKDRDNDELWYLRAVVSLKARNYDIAHEYLERASFIKKKPEYYRLRGMAHLQVYDIEKAVHEFTRAIALNPRDASAYFFLSLCFMFINDPRAKPMLRSAYILDRKRTKEMVRSFYEVFFKNNPAVEKGKRQELEKQIERISA